MLWLRNPNLQQEKRKAVHFQPQHSSGTLQRHSSGTLQRDTPESDTPDSDTAAGSLKSENLLIVIRTHFYWTILQNLLRYPATTLPYKAPAHTAKATSAVG
jgi:hypothetical protein